jgi:CheY-like chemotaxis protein
LKKDFYIYKCLREIHRLKQAELLTISKHRFLLILNTPGSLEHYMVHTDPEKLISIFNTLLDHVIQHLDKGSIELGYKLDPDDQLIFYVSEPIGLTYDQTKLETRFVEEAELLGRLTGMLSSLGGQTWIEKKPLSGKTYWFTADLHPQVQATAPGVEKKLSHPDWSDKCILLVDDVHTNLLLLEGILSPTNSRIIGVDNGLKAVNAVRKDKSIDLVLMDVRMPVLDGYEATRRIKRIRPWLPVIALSAYPGSAESEKWKLAGCDAFLGKPLNSSDLFATVTALIENVHSRA